MGPFRGFSKRLHAIADAYKASHLQGKPYTVMHWRSETLIARKDGRAVKAFEACAAELLDAIPTDGPVLLVADMPHDFDLPLWTSYERKLDRPPAFPRDVITSFLDAAYAKGVVKFDASDMSRLDRFDLGDVAIVEQILAVDAQLLITHRAEAGADAVKNWTGVGFDTCGYAGRFMRTMVTRRINAGRPVRNWLVDAGGRVTKYESAHKTKPKPIGHDPSGED